MVIMNVIGNKNVSDLNKYVMGSNLQITQIDHGGRGNQSKILTYSDGSKWVLLTDKWKERFCGFLYLEHALKEMDGLKKIQAASNKMAIHNKDVIYLSAYCGEKKPDFFEALEPISKLSKGIGYIDTAMCANLRKQDDVIFVFDTEKNSFDKAVYEKIELFSEKHDQIRTLLKDGLI